MTRKGAPIGTAGLTVVRHRASARCHSGEGQSGYVASAARGASATDRWDRAALTRAKRNNTFSVELSGGWGVWAGRKVLNYRDTDGTE